MQTYDWPENIRQLKNVIEWLLIMYGNNENFIIKTHDLPPEILKNENPKSDLSRDNFNLSLKEA